MKAIVIFLLAFVGGHLLLAQSTINSVPNQRLMNGSHVSNPDEILSEAAVTRIDSLLISLEKQTSVQVAVVALQSIGGEDIFDFAQKLFTLWSIGNKEKDNGLLLLLVKGNHTIRFHTGSGIEGVLPDALCLHIQRDYMIPEFKNENYDGGMLAGLLQVQKVMLDPAYAAELKEPADEEGSWSGFVAFLSIFIAPVLLIVFFIKARNGKFSDSKKKERTPYSEMLLKRSTWVIEFIGLPVLIVVLFGVSSMENPAALCGITLYLYSLCTKFHRLRRMKKVINRFLTKQNYYEIVEFLRAEQSYWLVMAILFPFPFLFYFFYHLARKRLYRNHPRVCALCKGKMRKQSEKTEDQFLSKEQQMEETLHSIDYDVWQCENCQATEEWLYPNKNSKYSACPKCHTWAYYEVGRKTVASATYSSDGRGEANHLCKFCGHTKVTTYSIAQLVASSSSGSSSSDSSSSSGGDSWGGGSSGGGGASSSW